jgi:protein phosphatase 2C family protein 2/3
LVLVAHVGDARVVLSREGVARPLTADHKPSSAAESERIVRAGGAVVGGRVGGGLGVSRSIGDLNYKAITREQLFAPAPSDENAPGGLWGPDMPVISRPDTLVLELHPRDEFFLVASDGLWDVMGSQEAVNLARWQLHEHSDIARACAELVAEAEARSSAPDNITALLLCVNQMAAEEDEEDEEQQVAAAAAAAV